ncbi:MAG: hypothetical protein JWN66_122 [Sphingomonas bacterium]|uniref:2OG-Fe(II) oxygenase n=1 Tax=Sphingomonas bacterium TaxID=1895847 RepID=UPI0026288476|nr:2OG-Fe(II) oxygenase [Sphingomonas bacterium]MDB5703006.1 hypothetical protein [Sphingomonas bacterium]
MSSSAPVFIRRDFLPAETADALLDYALANEGQFQPTLVGRQGEGLNNPKLRISLGTRDLGPFKPIVEAGVTDLVPEIVAALRMTPIQPARLEVEIVAHGDGAFYGRHTDFRRNPDSATIRALSAVYYFHARPRIFSGGALRLYPTLSASPDTFIDVQPDHNSLAVFPSWMMHEVMPVHCPSGEFRDSRFSINCWAHVTRPQNST